DDDYQIQIQLLKNRRDEIATAINRNAWDGKWYLRAFDDNGEPVGCSAAQEGKIYLNPQTWCIVSGVADQERAKQALASVKEHLYCDYGVKLSTPSYSKYNKFYGIITRYNLGTKENAGVFTQSNPWYMMALAKMGLGDDLYEVVRRINPFNRNDRAEIHKIEPYIYCQSIVSDENPICPGRGSNSWLTGTAGASMVAFCEHFFGVQPKLTGLQINPCIPSEWEQIKIKRVFRGKEYQITIINRSKTGFGVKRITLNGQTVEGNLIPESLAEARNEVIVEL
ncbi:MAG TPA: glycosyl transferase, partial [Bacillota bacterium]|nr:glycosyl transferase [Bacillota bacterium]